MAIAGAACIPNGRPRRARLPGRVSVSRAGRDPPSCEYTGRQTCAADHTFAAWRPPSGRRIGRPLTKPTESRPATFSCTPLRQAQIRLVAAAIRVADDRSHLEAARMSSTGSKTTFEIVAAADVQRQRTHLQRQVPGWTKRFSSTVSNPGMIAYLADYDLAVRHDGLKILLGNF